MAEARLDARSADRRHAADGQLRRPADICLQRRLHARRRELHPLLLLPCAVRRRHARRCHRQQPAPPLHVLGDRRPNLLPAHRLLVRQARGRGRREKGLHSHPHRRSRISAWHGLALCPVAHAALLRCRRWCARIGLPHPSRHPHHCPRPQPRLGYRHPHLLRCGRQSGQVPLHVWLPDAMEGPRPSARSSTPPPWSPPASSSSPASTR